MGERVNRVMKINVLIFPNGMGIKEIEETSDFLHEESGIDTELLFDLDEESAIQT